MPCLLGKEPSPPKISIFSMFSFTYSIIDQTKIFSSLLFAKTKNPELKKVTSCNIEIQTKWSLPVSSVGIVT